MPFPFSDVSARSVADLIALNGRSALITGGAQGLGRAIAERLAEAGANIALADLNGELASEAALAIGHRFGVTTIGVRMDVTDQNSVSDAAAEAAAVVGAPDIWVNNAGLFPSVPVQHMSVEAWDQVYAVNTRGAFLGAREAANQMTGNGGVIINIVSTAGFQTPAPGLSAYVSSKHAVRGMTKAMALEFAPLGIRVLGVAPSYVPTEGNIAMATAMMEQAAAAGVEIPSMDVMSQSLIGRIGRPDDIARVVLFAASDLSMIMTGSVLLADAGETI
ncbi:SDR family NAD(P)-dependent oxidoreductase [Microterricola viridarii]|uniref:NAD(P)-dependent dehydrogenase, short-chain alcohol dehydrogenase family n=1 Tax=Microterricola viridarii TaxID=412690 RepID=A0A1H1VDH0_9MICO|nr:SDR family oxidoreductase [Microterricola viridarii]SDS82785.1 NAD(P)-dependent dehydrogenase, short-chain alcohol dehydrogenase family [Microterricola viridarii]